MSYNKLFEVPNRTTFTTDFREPKQGMTFVADRRGEVYQYNEDLELAINVALVTGRPLLLFGQPGTGKSSVARNIARVLNWRYYEEVITSQTRAQDLLWKVDLLKRLHDANAARGNRAKVILDDWKRYISPGVLWWAFDPESALEHVAEKESAETKQQIADPHEKAQHRQQSVSRPGARAVATMPPAVVLLDEIDKADPDMPNNLLQPLGRLEFQVSETRRKVTVKHENAPLIIITTNRERSLPDAFVRRCVVFRIPHPSPEKLRALADVYFKSMEHYQEEGEALCTTLLEKLKVLRANDTGRKPSTAEFLDALEVALYWKLTSTSPELEKIVTATMEKALELEDESEGDKA